MSSAYSLKGIKCVYPSVIITIMKIIWKIISRNLESFNIIKMVLKTGLLYFLPQNNYRQWWKQFEQKSGVHPSGSSGKYTVMEFIFDLIRLSKLHICTSPLSFLCKQSSFLDPGCRKDERFHQSITIKWFFTFWFEFQCLINWFIFLIVLL